MKHEAFRERTSGLCLGNLNPLTEKKSVKEERKMKTRVFGKAISTLFAAVAVLILLGCGTTNTGNNNSNKTNPDISDPAQNSQNLTNVKFSEAEPNQKVGDDEGPFYAWDLYGQWKLFLYDNVEEGNGWQYIKLDINELGEASCLEFFDSVGNTSCSLVNDLPVFDISSDGVINTADSSIRGFMDSDKNTAYLDNISSNNGLAVQTGVMTKSANDFTNADVIGRWKIYMYDNGREGYGYNYLLVDINDLGDATCVEYFDNNGNSSCNDVPALPAIYVTPEGFITTGNAGVLGFMDKDKNAAYLARINDDGITVQTGVSVKESDDFVTEDLAGQWTVLLYGNGYDDNGWMQFKININDSGEATCLEFQDNIGNDSCRVVDPLPAFAISPSGVINTIGDEITGLMNSSRTVAYLADISMGDGSVVNTGFMTKASEGSYAPKLLGFNGISLEGQWKILLYENGNDVTGWLRVTVDINAFGDATCVDYIDDSGNTSCGVVEPLPPFVASPDGLISTPGDEIYGVLDADRSAAYISTISSGGVVIQTGVMTRASNNFSAANLVGQWKVFLNDNGQLGEYGYMYMTIDINELGEATCVEFADDIGNDSCRVVNPLPNFVITSDGLISTPGDAIYGVIDTDKTAAYLFAIDDHGVVLQTGVMTRATNDFDTANLIARSDGFDVARLSGRWMLTLYENGYDGNGWLQITMDLNEPGEATCVEFADDIGNDSCRVVDPLPNFVVTSDGLLSTPGDEIYGIVNVDRTAAYVSDITDDGIIIQTGFMTKLLQ